MSVNERASLETTRAPFPSSFCAESRPTCDRPVTRTREHENTRTRAPSSMSTFAVTSPLPLVPPIITTLYLGTVPWVFSSLVSNYFVLYSDAEAAVKDFLN
jgi:hypothetical protein